MANKSVSLPDRLSGDRGDKGLLTCTSVPGTDVAYLIGEKRVSPFRAEDGTPCVDLSDVVPGSAGRLFACPEELCDKRGLVAAVYPEGALREAAADEQVGGPAAEQRRRAQATLRPENLVRDGILPLSRERLSRCGVQEGEELVASGSFDHVELYGSTTFSRIRDEIDATLDVELYPVPPEVPEDGAGSGEQAGPEGAQGTEEPGGTER